MLVDPPPSIGRAERAGSAHVTLLPIPTGCLERKYPPLLLKKFAKFTDFKRAPNFRPRVWYLANSRELTPWQYIRARTCSPALRTYKRGVFLQG